MKNRWQSEIEKGVEQLDDEVRRRKNVSTVDPVADGISYATSEIKARLRTLMAPGRELTPAEWGAEQDPAVTEQAVRNWIRNGELDAREGPRGNLILAGAVRRRPERKTA